MRWDRCGAPVRFYGKPYGPCKRKVRPGRRCFNHRHKRKAGL
jgi:hypothetical protein